MRGGICQEDYGVGLVYGVIQVVCFIYEFCVFVFLFFLYCNNDQ